MKFAIIADIHANLEAFQVVLADSNSKNVPTWPVWVTWWATTQSQGSAWTSSGRRAGRWSKAITTNTAPRRTRSMASIPPQPSGELDPQTTHAGGPPVAARSQISAHGHELHHRPRNARCPAALGLRVRQACRRGQLHLPEHCGLLFRPHACARGVHARHAGARRHVFQFKVEPNKKYFVNVGAVGQPRDNNPRPATWCTMLRRHDRTAPAGIRHPCRFRKKILAAACRPGWPNGWLTADKQLLGPTSRWESSESGLTRRTDQHSRKWAFGVRHLEDPHP